MHCDLDIHKNKQVFKACDQIDLKYIHYLYKLYHVKKPDHDNDVVFERKLQGIHVHGA